MGWRCVRVALAVGAVVLCQAVLASAAAAFTFTAAPGATVSALLGNGDGTFRPAPGSPTTFPGSFAVADFNGDGKPDVGVVSCVPVDNTCSFTGSVLLGRGDGSFTPAPGPPGPPLGPKSVVAGDFNSDGKQDLAVLGGAGPQSGNVSVLLGDGTGHLMPPRGRPFPLDPPRSGFEEYALATGNFDGRLGLLVSHGEPDNGYLAVLLAPLASDPPTAALSASPSSAATGAPVLLDASASSDPLDRQIVDYRWDLGAGSFDHDTGTDSTLSWRFTKPGTYKVRVQVTNSAGQTATATVAVAATVPVIATVPPIVRRPPPNNAVVAGYIQVCGGPAPGRCRVEQLGLCARPRGCMTTDRVAAIDSTGRRVAVAKLKRGRFRLTLRPGRYTIELLADGRHVHGRALQHKRATARAHRTATIRFRFDVP